MSLSSQFKQSQLDAQDKQRTAELEKIGRACAYIAENFAEASKGISARALKGKERTWFQRRKTEKWIHGLKGVTRQDLAKPQEFFESIAGFRKLRDACASPDVDIYLWVYVSTGGPSVNISVNPTRPFSESAYTVDGAQIPLPSPAPVPAVSAASPAPVTLPPAAEKIVVMSPLRLK